MPVARGEEHRAPGQGHHFLGQDIRLDPAGLLMVVREARWGPPPQAVRQDQGQGVIQVAVGGAVGIHHPPGAAREPAPAPGQQVVALPMDPGKIFVGPGIDPGEDRRIVGPHRPEQGVGLGLGDGAAALLRDDDLAVALNEVPTVALPGRGEHPLQAGLRRVRLAGEAEPDDEDNQNEVSFSHDRLG